MVSYLEKNFRSNAEILPNLAGKVKVWVQASNAGHRLGQTTTKGKGLMGGYDSAELICDWMGAIDLSALVTEWPIKYHIFC